MQILTPPLPRNVVAGAEALPAFLLSGRPNGGKRPRDASARLDWDGSEHFGLDVRVEGVNLPYYGERGFPLFQQLENPGHSWLFVPLPVLVGFGIAGRISECSYVVGTMAALEEDCDAPVFEDAYKSRTGEGLRPGREVARVYDGLFEWDNAYDNFRAAQRQWSRSPGERRVLWPYSEAAAQRAVSLISAWIRKTGAAASQGRRRRRRAVSLISAPAGQPSSPYA